MKARPRLKDRSGNTYTQKQLKEKSITISWGKEFEQYLNYTVTQTVGKNKYDVGDQYSLVIEDLK